MSAIAIIAMRRRISILQAGSPPCLPLLTSFISFLDLGYARKFWQPNGSKVERRIVEPLRNSPRRAEALIRSLSLSILATIASVFQSARVFGVEISLGETTGC